jgi:hypothetical protein
MTEQEHLHIFVNRRRFGAAQGVKEEMTGAEIAALVNIAPDLAVIRRETPPHAGEIGVNQTVHIHNGEHFLVTRRVVEGGAC